MPPWEAQWKVNNRISIKQLLTNAATNLPTPYEAKYELRKMWENNLHDQWNLFEYLIGFSYQRLLGR